MRSIFTLRHWRWLHKWSSLICTAFLLVLCLTGLPLIFSHEIEDWLADEVPASASLPGGRIDDLDRMVDIAKVRYSSDIVRFVFIDDDEAKVKVVMAPADTPDRGNDHNVEFGMQGAEVLHDAPATNAQPMTFMRMMLRLHTELFAGLAGEMVLAAMGLILLVSLVSGTVLYAPYMRNLAFGTVRTRSPKIKWLDLHNLLGICVLVWLVLVGVTGTFNALSKPLFAIWRAAEMNSMSASYRGLSKTAHVASVQSAYDTARRALPDRNVTSIIYPSTSFSNPRHYLIWTNGNTALTSRLFDAVLVDAETGKLIDVAQMPLYLRILQVSRPLHFGDYGGLPLKIVWALLDLMTIVVLGSGIYLWLSRYKIRSTPGRRRNA